MGRPGPARPRPLGDPTLGTASFGRALSTQGGKPETRATAQNTGPIARSDGPHPDAMVPRSDLRRHRRRQLRHPRTGRTGRADSAETDPGQLVLPRCQPGRTTAAVLGQGTSSGQGEGSAQPRGSRREHQATADSGGRLVRRGPTPGRGRDRDRTLVQERPSPGGVALGLRPRPERNAPGSAISSPPTRR